MTGVDGVDLGEADREHLRRLVASWSMLADFCFSDLVLYVRDRRGRYVMANHVRPSTSQTIYETDIVGSTRSPTQRPLIDGAFREGTIRRGDVSSTWVGERVRVDAIPVVVGGRTVAVVAREFLPAYRHRPGELEQTYERVFQRFATMLTEGTFPYPSEDSEYVATPRVGDGVVVVDAAGAVEYASPNATSTLTRAGVDAALRGATSAELGLDDAVVRRGLASGRPAVAELERPGDVTVAFRVLPFTESGAVTGAVVLLRDVSDLRLRDRLLLSKDATISEIHHRVKNNLQTISSLLRLQGRQLDEPSARAAIEESVRRIRSIALVHETLSREPTDDVAFHELLRPLVRMVNEGLVSAEHPIGFRIEGDGGVVASEVATSLSLVVTELLQNAVEHAFPSSRRTEDGSCPAPEVRIVLSHDRGRIRVSVIDNGVGFVPSEVAARPGSLGQTIVEALVRDELRGTIAYGPADGDGSGTVVTVEVDAHKSWE